MHACTIPIHPCTYTNIGKTPDNYIHHSNYYIRGLGIMRLFRLLFADVEGQLD